MFHRRKLSVVAAPELTSKEDAAVLGRPTSRLYAT